MMPVNERSAPHNLHKTLLFTPLGQCAVPLGSTTRLNFKPVTPKNSYNQSNQQNSHLINSRTCAAFCCASLALRAPVRSRVLSWLTSSARNFLRGIITCLICFNLQDFCRRHSLNASASEPLRASPFVRVLSPQNSLTPLTPQRFLNPCHRLVCLFPRLLFYCSTIHYSTT